MIFSSLRMNVFWQLQTTTSAWLGLPPRMNLHPFAMTSLGMELFVSIAAGVNC